MQQLGKYVVSLTAAALISGILLSFFPEGTVRRLLRLACGMVLTVTALSPLTTVKLPDLTEMISEFQQTGSEAVTWGEEMAREERRQRIKTALEAYILDKAAHPGLHDCQVCLDAQGIPDSIVISGDIPESARRQLTEQISAELGISKEKLQWIG